MSIEELFRSRLDFPQQFVPPGRATLGLLELAISVRDVRGQFRTALLDQAAIEDLHQNLLLLQRQAAGSLKNVGEGRCVFHYRDLYANGEGHLRRASRPHLSQAYLVRRGGVKAQADGRGKVCHWLRQDSRPSSFCRSPDRFFPLKLGQPRDYNGGGVRSEELGVRIAAPCF